VAVIDTATNTVEPMTVPVGSEPLFLAITPDGKHVYVANYDSSIVSVIDTASNTMTATVPVGTSPNCVAIMPPPQGVPFAAFTAKLDIDLHKKPNRDGFQLRSQFILGQGSNGIDPVTEAVTLQLGPFTTTIPSGSFKGKKFGPFEFHGKIEGVDLHVAIEPTGGQAI
jgi:YVTN family beta-propeller protein